MDRSFDSRCPWTAYPTRLLAAALVLGVLAGGCGPSGPKRIQVHGKVTFDGNPPPGPGAVYFAPARHAEGFPSRGGYGSFNKGNGSFVVGSVKPDDGLMPGTYRVSIECWKRPPGADGTPGASLACGSFTPPELEIKVDQRGPVSYTVDVPLPR